VALYGIYSLESHPHGISHGGGGAGEGRVVGGALVKEEGGTEGSFEVDEVGGVDGINRGGWTSGAGERRGITGGKEVEEVDWATLVVGGVA